MFTKNDLLDLIAAALKNSPAAGAPPRKKKIFLSDWELKKMRAGGAAIHVSAEAIISPQAKDWLDYEGIKIIFDK